MNGGMSIEMYLAERDESRAAAELQRRVWEELKCDPGVDTSSLLVDVRARLATLEGSVTSYPQKVAAERAAKRTRGLQAVHSRIDVALPPDAVRSDEELAREVQQALAMDVGIDNLITVRPAAEPQQLDARVEDTLRHDPVLRGDRIQVEVFGDVVIMRGRVRSLAEQEEAEQAAALVSGVRAVQDALEVHG